MDEGMEAARSANADTRFAEELAERVVAGYFARGSERTRTEQYAEAIKAATYDYFRKHSASDRDANVFTNGLFLGMTVVAFAYQSEDEAHR